MNIEKAIEILAEFNVTWSQASHKEKRQAIKLGIEALKATQESRRLWGDTGVPTLPGETEGG